MSLMQGQGMRLPHSHNHSTNASMSITSSSQSSSAAPLTIAAPRHLVHRLPSHSTISNTNTLLHSQKVANVDYQGKVPLLTNCTHPLIRHKNHHSTHLATA